MKVILYCAISLDGFIAKTDGDSDWVTDTGAFEKEIQRCRGYIVGGSTFRQYLNEIYPIDNVLNIVLSKNSAAIKGCSVANKPERAIDIAQAAGLKEVVVVGGSETWQAFYDAGLVNEIILDIEPIMLGKGLPFLIAQQKLKLLSVRKLSQDVVQSRFAVE
jgi:dihydrofolate reductase